MVDNNPALSKLSRDELLELLTISQSQLAQLEEADWQADNLQSILNSLLIKTGRKPTVLFGLIRYALTWAAFSPGLAETMQLLAREETLARLDAAITAGSKQF
jgi:glutamyl-tRNA synthetase